MTRRSSNQLLRVVAETTTVDAYKGKKQGRKTQLSRPISEKLWYSSTQERDSCLSFLIEIVLVNIWMDLNVFFRERILKLSLFHLPSSIKSF